ncbi:MAG TPA: prepilin-type N-terminal cleavage/methylation domain-containing protein [Candidatus Woesebacteria bacterium]|nr:prepilin-type N-terminal cleavage/methylation domain-containing protein [Candidatus Woesebacteria bacterium]
MIMKKNGFTLVELLVVISIISILTIITVSQFQTAKRKSNDVQRKGDINSVSKALLTYYNDYNYFPNAVDGQIEGAIWGGSFEDTTSTPAYVYMKEMPRENYLDVPYCYQVDDSNSPKKFALFAQLENTEDKECIGSYSCNGNSYCYAVTSPNTSLNEDGTFK